MLEAQMAGGWVWGGVTGGRRPGASVALLSLCCEHLHEGPRLLAVVAGARGYAHAAALEGVAPLEEELLIARLALSASPADSSVWQLCVAALAVRVEG